MVVCFFCFVLLLPPPPPLCYRLCLVVVCATGCEGAGTAFPGSFARRGERRQGRLQGLVSATSDYHHNC